MSLSALSFTLPNQHTLPNTASPKRHFSRSMSISQILSHKQISCLCILDLVVVILDTLDHSLLLHLSTWFYIPSLISIPSVVHLAHLSSSISTIAIPLSSICLISSHLQCTTRLNSRIHSFNLYTTPLNSLISSSTISHLLFANDNFFLYFMKKIICYL